MKIIKMKAIQAAMMALALAFAPISFAQALYFYVHCFFVFLTEVSTFSVDPRYTSLIA